MEASMRTRAFVLVVGNLVLSAAMAMPALAADPPDAPDPEPSMGQFTTVCAYSHRAPDDPIVAPGQPGASHSHDFFGNTSTDADSTYRSLVRAGETTCRRAGDTAAYWVPSLLVNGSIRAPHHTTAYYQARNKTAGAIQPFPAGLKLIAGDARATAPQKLSVAAWKCSGEGNPFSADVPACEAGSHLVLRIRFPDCWDGRNLDSADHKSHLAYNVRGSCPVSHPVPVPGIALNIHYNGFRGGDGVSLASGGAHTGHADFFNAWDRKVLKALVERCLNGNVHCAQG
jgi:hypothetical protein